jgi:outer membrane protein, heavy metal efflux system
MGSLKNAEIRFQRQQSDDQPLPASWSGTYKLPIRIYGEACALCVRALLMTRFSRTFRRLVESLTRFAAEPFLMKWTYLGWGLSLVIAATALAEEPLPLPAPEPDQPVAALPVEDSSNQAEGITLEDLELMSQSHPAIAEAAAKVRAARGACLQAGLYPNPVLSYQGAEIGNEGRAGQQGGFLEQEYVTAGKLDYAQQAACWEVRRTQQEFATAQMQVLTEVRMRYYEAVIAEQAVKVVADLRKTAEAGLKLTEDRKAAQEVSDIDVLQSRFEAEAARLLAVQAESQLEAARRRLEATLGGISLGDLQIADDGMLEPGLLTWEQAWSQLQSASPALAAKRLDVERARWELRLQIASRIPNLSFQAGVQDDHATGDTVAGATVALPLPIYNCNQGNIEKARGELAMAQQAVGRLEAELLGRLAVAFREYQTALQQADRYREQMLPDADRALQLVKLAYGSGEVDYLRLLSAQQTYGRAHLEYLKTLEIVWTRQAQIEGLLTTAD